ncbi:MAG: hypothetical protein NVSMB47_07560 [Polyangiales bacterium]
MLRLLARMASPALESLKQQVDALNSEYGARFAGHSRVTRELADIESMITRARAIVTKLEAHPKADPDLAEVLTVARGNLDLYTTEREAIARAQSAGPALLEFAALGAQANLVFARYRRHFAGKPRPTRDLGLLAEMVEDLTKIQTRMRTLAMGKEPSQVDPDLDVVAGNLKMYVAERGEIVDARNAGTPEEQADVLAECANLQFQVYQDHFADKARLTRRPELLQRLIDNLKQIKDRMAGLKKAGLVSASNDRNVEIVQTNLEMYDRELKEIRKARAGVKLADLMGNLGGAANDVMNEYQENFAGKDRATRDLDLLGKLCDQLGELLRQMTALGRAEKNENNVRNMGITVDNLVMLEAEYEQIRKTKSA